MRRRGSGDAFCVGCASVGERVCGRRTCRLPGDRTSGALAPPSPPRPLAALALLLLLGRLAAAPPVLGRAGATLALELRRERPVLWLAPAKDGASSHARIGSHVCAIWMRAARPCPRTSTPAITSDLCSRSRSDSLSAVSGYGASPAAAMTRPIPRDAPACSSTPWKSSEVGLFAIGSRTRAMRNSEACAKIERSTFLRHPPSPLPSSGVTMLRQSRATTGAARLHCLRKASPSNVSDWPSTIGPTTLT
mmetsp:Transcript_28649/g.84471  ORF Transcript_28649/g.84471 Transcript_28649/m.84471 type:complete len:249 (-) Transcript_28649:1031-1777(-)